MSEYVFFSLRSKAFKEPSLQQYTVTKLHPQNPTLFFKGVSSLLRVFSPNHPPLNKRSLRLSMTSLFMVLELNSA